MAVCSRDPPRAPERSYRSTRNFILLFDFYSSFICYLHMNDVDLYPVIKALNNAVLEPDYWTDALDQLAESIGASSAIASRRMVSSPMSDDDIFRHASSRVPFDTLKHYLNEFADSDLPAVRRLQSWAERHGPGEIMDDIEAFGSNHLEERHPSLDALGDLFGCYRRAALALHNDYAIPDFLFVQYSADLEDFPAGSFQRLRKIAPFVGQALSMSRIWEERSEAALAGLLALEELPSPIAMINHDRALVFRNPAFEDHLGAGDTFSTDRQGRLYIADGPAQVKLLRWLADVKRHGNSVQPLRLLAHSPNGGGETVVEASPVFPPASSSRASNRILIVAKERNGEQRPDIAAIIELFGLTRTEAEVASLLASGAEYDDVLKARGISRNTLKTQVRSILQKTDARSSHDLARVLGPAGGLLRPGRAPRRSRDSDPPISS